MDGSPNEDERVSSSGQGRMAILVRAAVSSAATRPPKEPTPELYPQIQALSINPIL